MIWDGVGEYVAKDWSSHDGGSIGDDDGFDFPLTEGGFPDGIASPESKSTRVQDPPREGGTSSQNCSLHFFRSNRLI